MLLRCKKISKLLVKKLVISGYYFIKYVNLLAVSNSKFHMAALIKDKNKNGSEGNIICSPFSLVCCKCIDQKRIQTNFVQ